MVAVGGNNKSRVVGPKTKTISRKTLKCSVQMLATAESADNYLSS